LAKVLIAGAAGFIGSHLCDRFLKDGFSVIGLDNFITGTPDKIDRFSKSPKFSFIKCDITKYEFFLDKVDIILNFASPASPVSYMNFPVQTLLANSVGTFKTLEVAKANKARYIFASTSEIYGDPLVHPQDESYWGNANPIGSRSVYDEGKRFSEAIVMAYYRKNALDARILRIFNTYGPGMRSDDGRVIPNFIMRALKGEDLTVYGDGNQTRSFCYIDDIVEGILRVSLKEGIEGEVLNLGNQEEYKIIDLAKIIIEKTDSKSVIVFTPLPEDDPKKRCPDITKAKTMLGWEPCIDLEKGLENTIEFFKAKTNYGK